MIASIYFNKILLSKLVSKITMVKMAQINKDRLFFASCTSLLLTAMTFAVRARLETVFGPAGVGLTLEEPGYAFMPAFWGFTIAMMLGGPLVDTIGMKKGCG